MHLSEDNITVVERNEVSAAAVERAMVAIRRRQRNRALGRLTTDAAAQPIDEALLAVLDVVEEDNDAGVPCTTTSVAGRLGVDQPRASKLIGRAVDQGLLSREADQHDGRRSLLVLAPAGRTYLGVVHHHRRQAFALATENWSTQQRETFAELLTDFVHRLDQLPAQRKGPAEPGPDPGGTLGQLVQPPRSG